MDELMTWLRGVLDATERVAAKLDPIPASTWTRGDCMDASDYAFDLAAHATALRLDPVPLKARVEAERAILELHSDQHECPGTTGSTQWPPQPCDTLRWLAYGHRHDAPGYRPEWAPEATTEALR